MIYKIRSFIYILKIIIFEKDNWLEKNFLNKRSLQNFSNLDLNQDFYYSHKNLQNILFTGD